tara:strand:- start:1782 stop:1979 length:198 start_codon:yes stop_codon:yes gene_type:complete
MTVGATILLRSFINDQGNPGMIGLAALERARTWGYTDEMIKSMLAEEKLGLGWKAAASLFGIEVE